MSPSVSAKELRHAFAEAAWSNPTELSAFAEAVGVVPAAELTKLLSQLCEPEAASLDLPRHKARTALFQALVERALTRELFVPFVRALPVADDIVRETLVALLPRVNSPEDHGALCQALGHAQPEVRRAAAAVLGQVAGPHALEALLKLVTVDQYEGRVEALDVMVPRGRHRAIPLLVAVCVHGAPRERQRAVELLGDRELMAKDLPAAIAQLSTSLHDSQARVAGQAIRSLAQLLNEDDFFKMVGPFGDSPVAVIGQAWVEALGQYASGRAVGALGRALRLGPAVVRLGAVSSLERVGTEDVLPLLVHALGDTQIAVRNRASDALIALGRAGKLDLARTVIWLLRSRDPNVRRMAADIAREVGDPRGELIPKLLQFLRDEDWWVRERVIEALVQLAGERLTEHLVGYLEDPSDVVRRYAIGALRRVADPRALGALVRSALQDSDWWAREEALLAISELGDARAIPYLLKALESDAATRPICIDALRKLKATDAAPLIVGLLGERDSNTRLAAVRWLADLGTPAHADALGLLTLDPDPVIRAAAEEALGRWNLQHAATGGSATGFDSVLDRILVDASKLGADDVILVSGSTPYVKKLGQVVELSPICIDPADLEGMLLPILSGAQRRALENREEVDCSYRVRTHGLRFRVNLFRELPGLAAVFRFVHNRIPNIDTLGLPPVVKTFGDLRNGLVLVGGPTGSGKSTTLAALLDYINRTHSRHMVTIEDPIEVEHTRNLCLINQRESGTHTHGYERALRSAMRQDPDVLLIGEMRDLETISFALAAAETGHLVFGTVHTVSADTSVDRILNVFPAGQRVQMRSMVSESLRAVVCQHLVRRADRPGERVLAVEVMINNDAIANLIRKDKCFQIPSVLATARDQSMQSMDWHLLELVKQNVISMDEAYAKAYDKKVFETAIVNVAAPEAAAQAGASGRRSTVELPAAARR